MAPDQIVPLAQVGARLPGDLVIRKAKIRGEVSFGMLCSERELGISDRHEGILILPEDTPLGLPVQEVLEPLYGALELDVTPNRPDALSYVGIAREIAAKTGRTLHLPRTTAVAPVAEDRPIQVDLDAPEGCPRYVAGVVRNLKVGPSPDWMVRCLESAGQRSINNLVDISNFVLLELGHPTHVFDLDRFGSRTVRVRYAREGELFTTLDGMQRTLSAHHLLITNGKDPVALAGIMGGLESGVSETTTTVLIESAYFDPVTIRKGSKSLGMLTEASRRFERGADPEGVFPAFYRIVNLLQEYAGGELVAPVVDAYPVPVSRPTIRLRSSELETVSGLTFPEDDVVRILTSLEIQTTAGEEGVWVCQPPTFRPDLTREIDLIEEIVRVHGYDRVPSAPQFQSVFYEKETDTLAVLDRIREACTGLGLYECYNNSLTSPQQAFYGGAKPVAVLNPLTEQMTHLRTSLLPGLVQNAQYNFNVYQNRIQIFELGYTHRQEHPGFEGITSRLELAGLISGSFRDKDVHESKPLRHDFFSAKGLVETLMEALLTEPVHWERSESPYYGVGFRLKGQESPLGWFGELHTDFLRSCGFEETWPCFAFAFPVEPLVKQLQSTRLYRPVTTFPGIDRDLNFVIDEQIPAAAVLDCVYKKGGKQLRWARPVDVFQSESLGPGKKSLLIRLFFQSDSKTLEDSEINPIIQQIIKFAEKEIGAKLRS
ncbi:MAG: phenylalanine--tRNA ligase subunit beta [Candidatus Neomarinimicrobiota bacterium]|nr:MAG: phenylalanine--tRNA ligase subunit beta [Candidatus Neomarinimicrobiota bacterium]